MVKDSIHEILISLQKDFKSFKLNVNGMKEEFRVFKQEVCGIKEEFSVFKHGLRDMKEEFGGFKAEMRGIKDGFNVFKHDMFDVKKDIKEVKTTLNQHSSALFSIESTLKFYGDVYKANKEGVERLDRRVSVLESR
jgi:archaellum component FlaC